MSGDALVITMRAARVNAGLSQLEAAKQLGINKDTLWRYEKDNSNLSRNVIEKVENLYKIPSNNIFFGIESEYFRNLKSVE
ncbi:helix-turn-helix domain-containing protein [Macrococcus armenti]|uniref:helix-turn-helix domain-containing protein n=1 Tax=Macrococcus armenti TaxID=2875764 RepID=UPI001CD31ECD|nr:helix-turn-helix transcriptional regulator [Macrococcus armenti]UBH10636.1 helix-turn-helix domain-containing protein [Macrococcus armenti]